MAREHVVYDTVRLSRRALKLHQQLCEMPPPSVQGIFSLCQELVALVHCCDPGDCSTLMI